jgi:hypothetical protein
MIYCPKCGSPNLNTAPVCETCGVALAAPSQSLLQAPAAGLKPDEKRWIFLGNLCLSPLLGLVLYLVWKDSHRAKAQEVCRLTWWAVGIWGVLFVLMVIAAIFAEA